MRTAHTISLILLLAAAGSLPGQIRRDPNGVNVNSQGPTTVFITFGGLNNQVPVEAFWCGELIPAAPDIGQRCDPGTIFGRLPIRYEQSQTRGGVFTDIMSIPATVVRRAYEAAAAGRTSSFFYVRRFASTTGGRDEYVFVTCRMAGVGARVPMALLDVQLRFETEATILPVQAGGAPPKFFADIAYNGSGRLQGRWEIVLPGDDPPSSQDLLTEATLPVELRGLQRRYSQLERFNVFLPPTGKIRLEGPDPSKLPVGVEGLYMVLLRVEASDDKESDSNLALAGAGTGVVHSGGVAGFPMPVLRYYVGTLSAPLMPGTDSHVQQLLPREGASIARGGPFEFSWTEARSVPFWRLEVRGANDTKIADAVLTAGIGSYRLPPWAVEKIATGELQWRVVALGSDGEVMATTVWRKLLVVEPAPQ